MQESAGKRALSKTAGRKRPRKIWSCLECRRKKLQCDHGQPACGRCTKAGAPDKCQYSTGRRLPSERGLETEPPVPNTGDLVKSGTSTLANENKDLVSRLDSLEKTLKDYRDQPSTSLVPETSLTAESKQQIPEFHPRLLEKGYQKGDNPWSGEPNRSLLRGAAFRTKFNGKTCAETLVEHIPGLSSFTSDAFANFSAFEQAQLYLNKTETRTHLRIPEVSLIPENSLKALLPSREEADKLKLTYFQSFDLIFPVLHVPTFERHYQQVWTDEDQEDGRSTALVLLVMAISYCLTVDKEGTGKHLEWARDAATLIIDSCEIWLGYRVQKFDTGIDFQICFLLYLARQLHSRRSKRTWANSGNMLRTFQCSGLHREPLSLGKDTSQLDKVIRRRLWTATAEFELQAAFEHGMPAVPWRSQANVEPLRNVADTDLEARPLSVYTKESFLAVASSSLTLRHQLNDELNDMSQHMSFDRALWYTEELQRCIKDVPSDWDAPQATAAQSLLTITLHQFILAIHEQQLRLTGSPVERHFSRLTLMESAVQMIHSHRAALNSGSHLIELLYGDHERLALSMCIAYISADPSADRVLLSAFEKTVMDAMEETVSLYGDKVVHLGGGRVQLWLICAAEGVLRSFSYPDERQRHMQRAVEQFWKPFNRLIQSANTKSDMESQLQTINAGYEAHQNANGETLWTGDERQMLDDLTGWTFDDFCFDFNDFMHSSLPVTI